MAPQKGKRKVKTSARESMRKRGILKDRAEGRACMSLPLGFGNKAGHLVFTWVAAAPTTPSLARGTASLPRVTCSQPRSVRGLVGRRLTIARDRLCLPTASRADCAESALNAPSPARGRADTHAVACAQHGFVAVRGVLPAAELVAPRRRRARIARQQRRTCARSADDWAACSRSPARPGTLHLLMREVLVESAEVCEAAAAVCVVAVRVDLRGQKVPSATGAFLLGGAGAIVRDLYPKDTLGNRQ